MGRILSPQPGQAIWTVTNGEPCQRIYVGPSKCLSGHVLRVPGCADQGGYYVRHLIPYERESDILEQHVASAREAVSRAEQKLVSLQGRFQSALLEEAALSLDGGAAHE